MTLGRRFTIEHWADTFIVEVLPGPERAAATRSETERALSQLLFDYRNYDRRIGRSIETLHGALFSPALTTRSAPGAGASAASAVAMDRVSRDLEAAARAGRLSITRRLPSQPTRRELSLAPLAGVLGPAPEAEPTFFEATFVDEIGQPISGLAVVLTADGKPNQLTTDGSGKVRLDGVRASFADLRVSSVKGLRDIVEPRWTSTRPGKMPTAPGLLKLPLTDDLSNLSLESALPQLIVIVPPLGKIFIELFDRSGRVRHADRKYTISGPTSFSGTTDADGRLVHDEVLPGDYTLKLTLSFFEGTPHEVTDDYESALVVSDSAGSAPQQRRIGAVPFVVFARARGFLFDTNKSFLLPTAVGALEKMRDLYEQNSPSQLLIVGHTDTTAEPNINNPLSVARAKSVKAYLEDDVDTWLKNYDESGKGKWGPREDRLMVTAMPDFGLRTPDEDLISWFQRTRALTVDGKAGPETRKQLITEYMALDGTSLKDDDQFQIAITTHGAGENFPLAGTGLELDQAAANDQEDALDRRAELFFFDEDFGILPAPSTPDGKEYLEWRASAAENHDFPVAGIGRKATVIELQDALFRTNSCVVMPKGDAPSSGGKPAPTSVGVFASVLRFNEEHPGKKHFIAGHTDTTSTVDFNQTLSQERARCALALLDGDRDAFTALADERHTVGDYKQMLSFATQAFADLNVGSGGFDCDPGPIDDNPATGIAAVRKFQEQYNQNKAAIGATGPDLTVDGDVGPLTWGALFDMLEFALQRELGEDATGVTALRQKLTWVDDGRKALGFSEHHAVDQIGRDNVRSQSNRRVEILHFDLGEEPDLVLAESDPDVSELYLPGQFEHATLDPLVSALPWRGTWDALTAGINNTRLMQLQAPGLPAGTPLTFEVRLFGVGSLEPGTAVAAQDNAVIPFNAWDAPDDVPFVGDLAAGGEFPQAFFDFVIEGGGRRIESQNRLLYQDSVSLVLQVTDEGVQRTLANEAYTLCTPWGRRSGTTDAQGTLSEARLGPGGGLIALRGAHLVHSLVLDHGWDSG
jgi:outer membrane protein OmpA-like peptidoglycan-associated protein